MVRLFVALLLAACTAGCVSRPPAPPVRNPNDGLFAEISTPRGTLVCRLEFEKAPLTVASFVGLAEGKLGPAPGKPFFDGLVFHRIVPGFVIQGGDPEGTGRGGPGYTFPDEFFSGQRHDGPGLISMANSGPDSNGSQFFITLGEARHLDYVHSIFGRVERGAELLPQIARGDPMSVKIVRRGPAALAFATDAPAFNARLAAASRWSPPVFEDRTRLNVGPPPWQARYLEQRLANLARFTGRRIYLRLADSFPPKSPDQTTADALAELRQRWHLPPDAILAAFALDDNRWYLSGGPAGLALPDLSAAGTDAGPPSQSSLYKAAGLVVSGLIDQTDPK
ncbi:MAG: hypothetical protein B9S34_11915 [Opitutia bacterium Tous-C1TDCM]|nr:MAG: hypothetical protein B9S34_11915 [Opitutae bacterium Tous-C1TDCM]